MPIFDYADVDIPVTARMFQRRCTGYKAIGYEIDGCHEPGVVVLNFPK
jgi:hypothetical protein